MSLLVDNKVAARNSTEGLQSQFSLLDLNPGSFVQVIYCASLDLPKVASDSVEMYG